ncbi:MAG TPA: hypothetical protein VN754_07335, partial [Candidatus Binataceae bacterium]|nr:hypothetical protein [Candidatus Binataceae bacterium]
METTRNALSAGMLEFIQNPVQRRRRAGPPAPLLKCAPIDYLFSGYTLTRRTVSSWLSFVHEKEFG